MYVFILLNQTEQMTIFQLQFQEQELISRFLKENYGHSCEKPLRNITWTAV